jgi:hypothetical protein
VKNEDLTPMFFWRVKNEDLTPMFFLPIIEKVIDVPKEIIGDYCHENLLDIWMLSSAICFNLSDTWI